MIFLGDLHGPGCAVLIIVVVTLPQTRLASLPTFLLVKL